MDLERDGAAERFAQRDANYRGSVRIPLRCMRFVEPVPAQTTHLDPDNVLRIVNIFELEGCFRDDHENRIPALISAHNLRLLSLSYVYPAQEGEPPFLENPPFRFLQCLHGKHRHAAAKRHFQHETDLWWTVDLYEDGMSGSHIYALV